MADEIEIPTITDLIEKTYDQTQKGEQIHIQDALLTFAHVTEQNATLLGTKFDELSTLLSTKFDEVNANQTLIAQLIAAKLDNLILTTDTRLAEIESTLSNKFNQVDSTIVNTQLALRSKLENKFVNLTAGVQQMNTSLTNEINATRTAMMSVWAGVDSTEDYHEVLSLIDTGDFQTIANNINKGSILYSLLTSTMDFEELRTGSGGNLIAKAIRELGIRFDIMEARSALSAKHVKGGQKNNVHDSVKHQAPDVYNSYVEAKNNAITTS